MSNAVPRGFWKVQENEDKLRTLAALRMPAAHIATMMGLPVASVVSKAVELGLAFVRFTEEELAERRVRLREINRIKNARKAAKKRKVSILPPLPPGCTTGSPIWRNQLPRAPEMTVQQRRDFIAEAVRNTARMA